MRSNWRILYWRFELPRLSSRVYEQWLCGRVHVVINSFGDFNIGEFSEKSPIANINSSPINRLVRYFINTRASINALVIVNTIIGLAALERGRRELCT